MITPLGKFIVIEGLDYSGKTTVTTALVEELRKQRVEKILHTSCSDKKNRISEMIKENVLNRKPSPDIDTQALLFGAAINDLLHTFIIPNINDGHWVICERYTMSNKVFQGGSLLTNAITSAIDRKLKPDLTFIFDITPTEYNERKYTRDEEPDSLEDACDEEILQRRKAYRIQSRNTENCVLVDGTLPIEENVKIIIDRLNSLA